MKRRRGIKPLSVLLATVLFLASSVSFGKLPFARASAPATDLIISEYIEGSSNNKAIELFNGTPNTVDLSAYSVELYSNGGTTPGNTVTLSGTLDSGSVYVIANASAVTGILEKKNITSTVTYFNGDDAFVLKHDGNIIDSFGQVGFDPGSAWGSGTFSTVDHTLVRKSSVTAGDSNSSDAFDPTVEWDVYDKDTFTYLGSHTMDGFGGGEPQDTIKPVITHTPLTTAPAGNSLDITCQAADNIAVSAVKLYYRIKGQTEFKSLNMSLADGLYKATVPKEDLTVTGLEYYLEASDGTNVTTAPEDYTVPYEVNVLDIDTVGPEVSGLTPANGASTGENLRPVISAQYSDRSGIKVSSVAMYLDTVAIPGDKLTVSETGVTYTPDTDISLGKHTARLVVSDNSPTLNQTEVTWDFYVGQVEYNLYFGGFHSHTNLSDGTGTPDDAYTWARDEAKVDFLAITDHSNSFDNDTDYTKSAEWKLLRETADKYNDPGKFVAIGAYEMTWSGSTGGWGHINTFNTDWFETRNHSTMDLKAYYALLAQNPQSISQLNHPGPTFGDFADFGYYTPAADQVVNLIEVGNGEGAVRSSGYFPSYDYYTRVLDKGWHLAPTNNQDNHKGKWGNANTARTVVLAPSLTRENVYDAMHNMRVYATEDENLQIKYTVNGQQMGSFLNNPGQLNISINLTDPDATDQIGKVSLIVDGGKVADSKTFDTNTATWDLTLDPQYTYYYVRVDEADRDIAVTAPVWTGEVVPVGISKVDVSQDPQIVNQSVDITATVYNNGTTPLSNVKVEFYKNAVAPENKIGEQTIAAINPAGIENAKITWTPTEPGNYKLYAQAVIPVDGVDKSFTASTTLEAANEADLVKVVIDGGHQNQYVSGDYPGKIVTLTSMLKAKKIMLVQNPDELTAADLQNAKVLIITDPQSKDNAAKSLTKSNFTDAEIQVIKDFVNSGGSLIITSRADYDDKGITDSSYESSKQGNQVLAAIGSNLQFNDDEVIDNTSNGGQNYRLYFDDYTSAKYHLTDNIPSNETYSAYSGCSVIPKEGGNANAVDWLVKGHDTTETMDSDLQNDATAVTKGNVNALAAEILPNGSRVIVAGTTFFSDFETAVLDNAYSNAKITDNIINWLTEPKPAVLKTIADVRVDADHNGVPDLLGQRYAVEGRVTAESVGVGSTNAFFDVIYVQDATGGLTIFGVSNRVIPLGAKVRITGKVGQYEGDSQIQISNENTDVEVLDATPLLVEPKVLSTLETMDESNEGWLIKTEGEVKQIGNGNGDNSLYIDDNSGEAKVYLNGYIGDGTTNPDTLGHWDSTINVGDRVSVIGLASQDAAGHRIRVRNSAEIVKLSGGPGVPNPPEYQSVSANNAKIVTITFNDDLAKASPDLDLKSAIQFAANGTDFTSLGANDTVEINGKTLVVTFANDLSGNLNKIQIAGGTLKGIDGDILESSVTTEAFDATIDECFIATASFGSKFQPAVVLLRHFRDQFLLTNALGKAFVSFYYHYSPPIAKFIAGNEILKFITRVLLMPFVMVVYLLFHPVLLLFILGAISIYLVRRFRKRAGFVG